MPIYAYIDDKHESVVINGSTFVPWDAIHDQPLDIDGEVGRHWIADGHPKPNDPPPKEPST